MTALKNGFHKFSDISVVLRHKGEPDHYISRHEDGGIEFKDHDERTGDPNIIIRNKNEMFQQWIMDCMGDKISIGVAGETIQAIPLGRKENENDTWILAADSIPEVLL